MTLLDTEGFYYKPKHQAKMIRLSFRIDFSNDIPPRVPSIIGETVFYNNGVSIAVESRIRKLKLASYFGTAVHKFLSANLNE